MHKSLGMLCVAVGALSFACSSSPTESVGNGAAAATQDAQADWSGFPDYQQCLVGVQLFYPARFDAHVPSARNWATGSCASEGACHIWIDDIPDPDVWERIANDGSEPPSTYDLIVFPETSANPWGHIASVDHVDANGDVYVMDDNYNSDERRAWKPHTVWRAAYGWYHLRALPKDTGAPPQPPPPQSAWCPNNGLYCGGDYIQGDANTLYRCSGHALAIEASCSNGCQVQPDGYDDYCR